MVDPLGCWALVDPHDPHGFVKRVWTQKQLTVWHGWKGITWSVSEAAWILLTWETLLNNKKIIIQGHVEVLYCSILIKIIWGNCFSSKNNSYAPCDSSWELVSSVCGVSVVKEVADSRLFHSLNAWKWTAAYSRWCCGKKSGCFCKPDSWTAVFFTSYARMDQLTRLNNVH